MRISSNQIFASGLSGILKRQSDLLKLQSQAATGKRVEKPSDDPIASAKIDLMKKRIAAGESFQDASQTTKSNLQFEESILTSITGVINQFKDIQLQAGNAALSLDDRKALAREATDLLSQLQGLANTKDSSGYFIFSGSKSLTQTISRSTSGDYVYNGDQSQRYQFITSGVSLAANDTGQDIFMGIKNGNGYFSVDTTGFTNQGAVVMSSGNITNFSSYVPDDYTVQFALNSSNQMVVMVSGANSGNIIPPTGLADDAPLYVSGQSLAFNGIEITPSGTPSAGDGFHIKPSVSESMFSLVNRMIVNLQRPVLTDVNKAVIATENNQLLDGLDSSLNNVLNIQASVGARLAQIEVADKVNEDLVFTSTETLSSLEDADIAATLSQIVQQTTALQVAQKSFANVQGLSLFDYIR